MPSADKATILSSLRQGLLLLAQQDFPPPVLWTELTKARLPWADFQLLVPASVVSQSIGPFDENAGPPAEDPIPRRVLELLRTQLDRIVSEWARANTELAAKAEQDQAHVAWSQSVMDNARRLQDVKRLADKSPEAPTPATRPRTCPATARQVAKAKQAADEAATAAEASAAAAPADASAFPAIGAAVATDGTSDEAPAVATPHRSPSPVRRLRSPSPAATPLQPPQPLATTTAPDAVTKPQQAFRAPPLPDLSSHAARPP